MKEFWYHEDIITLMVDEFNRENNEDGLSKNMREDFGSGYYYGCSD